MSAWRGAVALVLAIAIGIGWIATVIIVLLNPREMSHYGNVLLYAFAGTLIGGVVGFLTGNVRKGDDE